MDRYKLFKGIYFDIQTPDTVVKILGYLNKGGDRIRIYYGDRETGQSWGECYDVWGRIGSSTGEIKIPLLCHNINSAGGPAILSHCIVGIRTKKFWLYKHKDFTPHENEVFPKSLGVVNWMPSGDGDIKIVEK